MAEEKQEKQEKPKQEGQETTLDDKQYQSPCYERCCT